jgi:uncharacterized protein (TIGR02594 family)
VLILPPNTVPPWTLIALGFHGVKEVPGPASSPQVAKFHKSTAAGVPKGVDSDAVHWCSSFQCHCAEQSGIRSPRSKSAIAWEQWGVLLVEPRLGCFAVYSRRDPANPNARHVGQWLMRIGEMDIVLGGNQGNEVSIEPIPWSRLVGYRWPAGTSKP